MFYKVAVTLGLLGFFIKADKLPPHNFSISTEDISTIYDENVDTSTDIAQTTHAVTSPVQDAVKENNFDAYSKNGDTITDIFTEPTESINITMKRLGENATPDALSEISFTTEYENSSEFKSEEVLKNESPVEVASYQKYFIPLNTSSLITVLEQMYVEPADCSDCDGGGTCGMLENIEKNVSVVHFDSGYEEGNVGREDSANKDIEHLHSELKLTENSLSDLYNKVIFMSKRYACKLDASDGTIALNLSETYVERRQNFLIKMIEFVKLLNKMDTETDESNLDPYSINDNKESVYVSNLDPYSINDNKKSVYADLNVPEIKLYQQNLHFTTNVTEILEILSNVSRQEREIEDQKDFLNKIADHNKNYPDITFLREIVKQISNLEEKCNNTVQNIKSFKLFLEANINLNNIFNTSATSNLMNLNKWKKKLIFTNYEAEMWTLNLDSKLLVVTFYEKVEIVLSGILSVIGIVGNGLLLTIFIRENEARITSNIMLMNIAVVDLFFLLLHIPTFFRTDALLNEAICKMYHFARVLCIAVIVYSLIMITFQRFLTLSVFFTRGGCLANKSKYLLVSIIWFVGAIIALPYGLLSSVENNSTCYDLKFKEMQYRAGIALFDVIILCIIPVCLITVFWSSTVDVQEHGSDYCEVKGREVMKRTKALPSSVLIGLCFVFAISYVPFYIFRFSFVWSNSKVNIQYYEYIVSIMPFLLYLNPCLNPIALYIFDKTYRRHFDFYLLCGKKEISVDLHQKSLTASAITVESNL